MIKILKDGSLEESDELQELWAGLLTAKATEIPDDDNSIFINLLSQLTSKEVRIINFACETSEKYLEKGLLTCRDLKVDLETLKKISNIN